MKLLLENLRCFSGLHATPLSPITVLLGENSTGKSSFLAACRLAWDMFRGIAPNFNEEPFRLGAFDDIVCRVDTNPSFFGLGFQISPRTKDGRPIGPPVSEEIVCRSKFISQAGQPSLVERSIRCGPFSVASKSTGSGDASDPLITVQSPSGSLSLSSAGAGLFGPTGHLLIYLRHIDLFGRKGPETKTLDPSRFPGLAGSIAREDWEVVQRMLAGVESALNTPTPLATAPIRTRPFRTYDPITDKPTAEGEHVPMLLIKLKEATRKDQWTKLANALSEFGAATGMFASIDVKRLGDSASLPFQIRVSSPGTPDCNLLDVGYGVSQVLPVLVDAIRNPDRVLLLQQPEVHLHPRAQAELATFLAGLISGRNQPIVVETHSDYLVDRLRMDIRDGRGLTPDDVVILYFEKTGGKATITPIHIDEHGNLRDAPSSYRRFFMEEDRRFLNG